MVFFKMPKLGLGKRTAMLPIVQGGMGVGISLSGLASAVANEGGIGVIAANAIGVLESDYYTNSREANLRALRREIRKAKEKTTGLIGVNIMVAVNDFPAQLEIAIEEKVDAVFLGAGLPIKGIPVEKLRNSGVALVPIVSSRRAAELIFKYWAKTYHDIPDAVVVEGPLAGGHLGFSEEDLNNSELKLETIVSQVVEAMAEFQKTFQKNIPVIAAGGVFTGNDIYKFLQLGAQGVQMATRFVATDECDADIRFKEAYINCQQEDITIIKSPVGMPGRAIYNSFLRNADAGIRNASRCAWRCLKSCDIKHANYCISDALDNARQGNLDKGFVFCGANAFRVDKIIPVRELIHSLKMEYEAEWINELVILKDEYLSMIERGFSAVRKEYERSTQRLGRLKEEYGKSLERKISGWKDEYEKALDGVNLIKQDYEYALMKLNELINRFPERGIELKAITKRF